MQLVYAKHKDGTEIVADWYRNHASKDAVVVKPVDMHAEEKLYSGYTDNLLNRLYPGSPILTYYHTYPDWKFFQPQTYKYRDVYKLKRAGVRGTLAGSIGSAYHVLAVGTWVNDKLVYEMPNTPCAIRFLKSEFNVGHTSYLTPPARFIRGSPLVTHNEYEFELDRDIALADYNVPVYDKCLVFDQEKPNFVKCEVIGIVSGVLGGYTYVAPLREIMPSTPVYITGSSSGTIILEPLGRVTEYVFAMSFDNNKWYLVIRNGWVFKGEVKPGDSGAPVFVLH